MRTRLLFIVVFLALATNALQAQSHIKDVVYGKKLGVALTFDIFKPEKPNGVGVVWMVSGGWVSNHNSINANIAKPFTSRGMTVFQVVHGSQPKFTLPEIVADIHRAIRFIRTHAKEYGVDPERIGISGGSAGGHLSLMMAAYGVVGDTKAADPIDRASSAVQAVAIFYPPTDFLNYGQEGKYALEIPELKPFYHVFGVGNSPTREEMEKALRPLSPIYGFATTPPPTLIIHGDADTLVPIQQAERILAKMKEKGGTTQLDTRKGKGHGWAGIEKDLDLFAEWFNKHLGKDSTK